jgi:hypothetical protein
MKRCKNISSLRAESLASWQYKNSDSLGTAGTSTPLWKDGGLILLSDSLDSPCDPPKQELPVIRPAHFTETSRYFSLSWPAVMWRSTSISSR